MQPYRRPGQKIFNRSHGGHWLSVAVDLGYYGYQHPIRDFKEFTKLTPAAFYEADTKSPERIFGVTET